ncbi:sensor histidine kinase [Isoptericola dokdonensis]|uniref:histidine kinase n=1 Tax=Isoptericola dokdonensis DS-3 TaxID=1300344 RepID=A0A168FVS0_9MICO|nr:HAMP domain-containing sensor histidine kinase [Isoptericola dokdonensis]ANC32581.1 putative sensor histidine kinase TcrY [Isoptericola dokdonensis DS-3]
MTSRPPADDPVFAAPGATPGPSRPTTGATSATADPTPDATPDATPSDALRPPADDDADGTAGDGRTRWGWFARVPLRARLVAIIVLLLGAGLVFAGFATRAVVSEYLVKQLDSQLTQAVRDKSAFGDLSGTGQGLGPSEYVLVLRDTEGTTYPAHAWPQTEEQYGTPVLPDETVDEAVERGEEPFTTTGSGGAEPTDWRVVTVPVRISTVDGPQAGVAYVGLPMAAVDKTVSFLTRSLLWSGIGIVLLGGLGAFWLVQHSLRPLRRIESTAAAIADGDLSQRVPEQPRSTEVGSLSHSLNTMLAQIEVAFAAQEASEQRMRRFVSDASHELRTPLATIKGYGELYRMGALDTGDKVEDTMVRIEDSARRMGTLVNDLLVLARLDEGRPMRQEAVDLVPMVRDTAQDLHALDPTRTVTVAGLAPGSAAPPSLVVTGDADRLRQVLTNLVGNVARHTPAGSPAEILLGRGPDGAAVVEVRDHGPGISEEQAAKIFERFYRADSSRNRSSGGSGLGLAIVAAILASHGGRTEVGTTPGGGLTVRVMLPRRDDYDASRS